MHPWLLPMTMIGMMADITFNRRLIIITLSPRFILIRNPRYIPIILSPGSTIIILPKIRIMVTTGDTAMATAIATPIAIFVATSMTTTMTDPNLKSSAPSLPSHRPVRVVFTPAISTALIIRRNEGGSITPSIRLCNSTPSFR
jgi:hypothetical protein